MIVCSCNMITSEEIEEAVGQLVTADTMAVLTPLSVFHALGRRPRCGGCMALVVQLMHEAGQRLRET